MRLTRAVFGRAAVSRGPSGRGGSMTRTLSLGLGRRRYCRASDVGLAGELSPQWPGRWPAASSSTRGWCQAKDPAQVLAFPPGTSQLSLPWCR